jgi:hypothetical protein
LLKLLKACIRKNSHPIWSILSDRPSNSIIPTAKTYNDIAENIAMGIEALITGLGKDQMGLSRERLSLEEQALEKVHGRNIENNGHRGLSCEPTTENVDSVNHPPHYNNGLAECKCGRKIECIDVTRHLSFNIGNAMKYLWRCELKGNTLEDLKKAAWYISDEIAKREKSA